MPLAFLLVVSVFCCIRKALATKGTRGERRVRLASVDTAVV